MVKVIPASFPALVMITRRAGTSVATPAVASEPLSVSGPALALLCDCAMPLPTAVGSCSVTLRTLPTGSVAPGARGRLGLLPRAGGGVRGGPGLLGGRRVPLSSFARGVHRLGGCGLFRPAPIPKVR